jgi:hypothetical protein
LFLFCNSKRKVAELPESEIEIPVSFNNSFLSLNNGAKIEISRNKNF